MVARVEHRPAQAAPTSSPWLALRRIAATFQTTLETIGRTRIARLIPRRRAQVLSDAAGRVLLAHGIEVDVSGTIDAHPAILVANHLGYLDALIVSSLVPCAPIAKSEFAGWPLLGSCARGAGVLFVQRGNVMSGARVLRTAKRLLAANVPVLNFPEGTTTLGSSVGRFQRGVFGLAQITGVPIVPIALRFPLELCWAGDEYFLPHYLRTASRSQARVTVQFGAPISPAGFDDAEELAEATRKRIHRMLRRNS
jgi:1-acyl-sn-glycerol-3-phosphate acyltransferase